MMFETYNTKDMAHTVYGGMPAMTKQGVTDWFVNFWVDVDETLADDDSTQEQIEWAAEETTDNVARLLEMVNNHWNVAFTD